MITADSPVAHRSTQVNYIGRKCRVESGLRSLPMLFASAHLKCLSVFLVGDINLNSLVRKTTQAGLSAGIGSLRETPAPFRDCISRLPRRPGQLGIARAVEQLRKQPEGYHVRHAADQARGLHPATHRVPDAGLLAVDVEGSKDESSGRSEDPQTALIQTGVGGESVQYAEVVASGGGNLISPRKTLPMLQAHRSFQR